MVFSSVVFLTVFLPLFLAIYYLTPARWRSVVILLGSYLFYAWWRVDFLALFAGVTAFNYALGIKIANNSDRKRLARRWLQLGLAGNLGTLAYFKYANFGDARSRRRNIRSLALDRQRVTGVHSGAALSAKRTGAKGKSRSRCGNKRSWDVIATGWWFSGIKIVLSHRVLA